MHGKCPTCGHEYPQQIIELNEEDSRLWREKPSVISNSSLLGGFLMLWVLGWFLVLKFGDEYREHLGCFFQFLPTDQEIKGLILLLISGAVPVGISFLIFSYIEDHYNVPRYKAKRDEKKAIIERHGIWPTVVPFGISYSFPEIGKPGEWGKKYALVFRKKEKSG